MTAECTIHVVIVMLSTSPILINFSVVTQLVCLNWSTFVDYRIGRNFPCCNFWHGLLLLWWLPCCVVLVVNGKVYFSPYQSLKFNIWFVLIRLVHDRELQLFDGTRLIGKDRYEAIKKEHDLTDEDMKQRSDDGLLVLSYCVNPLYLFKSSKLF